MIPEIGIMVGSYIIIRMFSFFMRSGERAEHKFVAILCLLNIFFTAFIMIDLFLKSLTGATK